MLWGWMHAWPHPKGGDRLPSRVACGLCFSTIVMVLPSSTRLPYAFNICRSVRRVRRGQLPLSRLARGCGLACLRARGLCCGFHLQLQPDGEAPSAGVRMESRADLALLYDCGIVGGGLLAIHRASAGSRGAAQVDRRLHGRAGRGPRRDVRAHAEPLAAVHHRGVHWCCRQRNLPAWLWTHYCDVVRAQAGRRAFAGCGWIGHWVAADSAACGAIHLTLRLARDLHPAGGAAVVYWCSADLVFRSDGACYSSSKGGSADGNHLRTRTVFAWFSASGSGLVRHVAG